MATPPACRSLQVRSDLVGAVIGPHGARISRIRSLSGARINTDRTNSLTQLITFEGSDEQVERAMAMVREVLAEMEAGAPGNIHDAPAPLPPIAPLAPLAPLPPFHSVIRASCTLLLQTDEVARLIGSHGATIKRIRSESAARINTDRSEGARQEVLIEGTADKVQIALAMIGAVMAEGARRGELGVNLTLFFPPEAVSAVIGVRGDGPLMRIRTTPLCNTMPPNLLTKLSLSVRTLFAILRQVRRSSRFEPPQAAGSTQIARQGKSSPCTSRACNHRWKSLSRWPARRAPLPFHQASWQS